MTTVYVSTYRDFNDTPERFRWSCGCGRRGEGYADERKCRDEGLVHQLSHKAPDAESEAEE